MFSIKMYYSLIILMYLIMHLEKINHIYNQCTMQCAWEAKGLKLILVVP